MDNTWVKRNKWIFFVGPLALVAFVALFGEMVMHLWNWLLPMLFGWRQISFWQALGLLVLCRILFGGMSHKAVGPKGRRRRSDQWEAMTPEEREHFRQSWRARCGNFDTSPTESNKPA